MKINSKIKERSLKICLYIRNQLKLYKKTWSKPGGSNGTVHGKLPYMVPRDLKKINKRHNTTKHSPCDPSSCGLYSAAE